MAFDNELKLKLIRQADIVKIISSYITLTKKGKNYWGICPFHDDNHASLCVSPEKKLYKCFSCGHGGDVIHFVQSYEHINYFEALKKVADMSDFHDPALEKAGPSKPKDERRENILSCLADLSLYYSYALSTQEGKEGLDYFTSRNLDAKLRNQFKLGYANKDGKATINFLQKKGYSLKTIEDTGITTISNSGAYDKNQGRVIFPISDQEGNVIGFSARRLNNNADESKYINSPETYVFHKSNVLYNYHIAKDASKQTGFLYICEGFMDVFALAKIGINSCVALMGTALSEEHISMLKRLNVELRLCLDGDLPGQTAMMKAVKQFQTRGIEIRIVDNQGTTLDPDEILNSQGEEALRSYLNNLLSPIDFALNYYLRSNPLKTSEEKRRLILEFIPILLKIKSVLEFDSYVRKLSKVTGYDVESIKSVVKTYQNAPSSENITMESFKNAFPTGNKEFRKLFNAEHELLYQMTKNDDAVSFYEHNVKGFYHETYRMIANFIIDYASNHKNVDPSGLISSLQDSDLENKEELIKTLIDITFENTHPDKCDEELLNDLLRSINIEKDKIFEQDTLNQSLEGKDDLEKARILNEYNRRRNKKGL